MDPGLEFVGDEYRQVYLAVGANIGDRFQNITAAIGMLEATPAPGGSTKPPIRLLQTSFLRETAPMYVLDQPRFLNGVIKVDTRLSPHALLRRLKEVEGDIGRDLKTGVRYGPRLIDLDIIYYGVGADAEDHGGVVVDSPALQVPHPRMQERDFVLSPLCDLDRKVVHPSLHKSTEDLLGELQAAVGDSESPAVRILPLPRGRVLPMGETAIMGILNVTPDSFSDGGNYEGSADLAVEQALRLVGDGASVIDVGGESTRPGAKEVEADVELQRTIPVIRKLREASDVPISIDTRHAAVAQAAIGAGADIVNDVSGGLFDPDMLPTVARLHVPMVIMHSRGTPETMQGMTQYDDVVSEVSAALAERSRVAEAAGIPRWSQVLDPGIGFAKDLGQNLSLIKHTPAMRSAVGDVPLLLGPSRKGFIGKITGEAAPEQRDFGTLASCIAGMAGSDGKVAPTILRVHNVRGVRQGVQIAEAISKAK